MQSKFELVKLKALKGEFEAEQCALSAIPPSVLASGNDSPDSLAAGAMPVEAALHTDAYSTETSDSTDITTRAAVAGGESSEARHATTLRQAH